MIWMVTLLDSDVAPGPPRSRRAARLSVAMLQQSTGAGSGRCQEKRTRHALLRGYVLVDYSRGSWCSSSKQQQQQQSVALCHNTKYQDRLTQAHSARLFAARPEAVSVDSDAWILRAVQRLSASLCGARPQQTAVGLGVCSNLYTHNYYYFILFRVGKLFRIAKFTSENAIWVKI